MSDGRGRPSIFQTAGEIDTRDFANWCREVAGVTQLLKIEDVMEILQVSRSWCYHDRDQDRVLPWLKVGRHVRLHPDDLKRFIDAQRLGTKQTIMRRERVIEEPMESDLSDYK